MTRAAAALQAGHGLRLLEGSRTLFPALVFAIEGARRSVRLETYIFDFGGGAERVARALEGAAARGVRVQVVVDGLGTPPLASPWRERFASAGVQWRVYSPLDRFSLLIPARWRRLHRKLCVVDGAVAFCGGINILDDLLDPNYGALEAPRFDFAVEARGPLVARVLAAMDQLWLRLKAGRKLREGELAEAVEALGEAGIGEPEVAGSAAAAAPAAAPRAPAARAALLLRDNVRNRSRIERAYRRAIGQARHEIVIANAYFVPGRRMRSALVRAARRGVRVRLLLQGRYEYFMQYYSARIVYGVLLRAGVEIHEYAPSFLHAKVAVVDGHWATVGSSNLDPLSLLLAREANVVVDDAAFAAALRDRLDLAMRTEGTPVDVAAYERRPWPGRIKEAVALFVMRLALRVQRKDYL